MSTTFVIIASIVIIIVIIFLAIMPIVSIPCADRRPTKTKDPIEVPLEGKRTNKPLGVEDN